MEFGNESFALPIGNFDTLVPELIPYAFVGPKNYIEQLANASGAVVHGD